MGHFMLDIKIGEILHTYYEDLFMYTAEMVLEHLSKMNKEYYNWIMMYPPKNFKVTRKKEYLPYCDYIIFEVFIQYETEEQALFHILCWGNLCQILY